VDEPREAVHVRRTHAALGQDHGAEADRARLQGARVARNRVLVRRDAAQVEDV
jgi:hypothetical protein